MPQVALTTEQKTQSKMKDIRKAINEAMDDRNINQTEIARELGMTQGGYSLALSRMTFSTIQLIKIFTFLKVEPEKIGNLFIL